MANTTKQTPLDYGSGGSKRTTRLNNATSYTGKGEMTLVARVAAPKTKLKG